MDDQKQVIIDKLKGANNILVTVSANPSVDQLAACIGLTIFLNKQKKHASAVFSGQIPNTIEFLQPEDTLEKNTDSLRDFIISLDKSKADKLRYKVEENVVKIFITPYKTSIDQDDLEFSQGDFNVDVVLALGVHEQQELDEAITMHGRILHDAVVISVNTAPGGELGSVNWTEPKASSLSELAVQIAKGLGKDLIDGQIATAFLTGIVAETGRFSNEKTTPDTMKLSAELLTAGANQQLVASSLGHDSDEPPHDEPSDHHDDGGSSKPAPPTPNDGTLEISHPQAEDDEEHHYISHEEPHDESAKPEEHEDLTLPEPTPNVKDVKQSDFENPPMPAERYVAGPSQLPPPHYLTEPPRMGGEMTANTEEEDEDDRLDMLAENHEDVPLLERDKLGAQPPAGQSQNSTPPKPPKQAAAPKPQEPEIHEPELVQEPVKDEPKPDLPLLARDTELNPMFQAGSFEPLPSEPYVARQPQPVPASLAPEPPKSLNDQIHIDVDGNIQMPPAPVAPVVVPPAQTPLVVFPATVTPSPAPPELAGATPPSADDKTLVDIEKAVHSPHVETVEPPIEPLSEPAPAPTDLDAARNAVSSAYSGAPPPVPGPTQSVGASGYLNVQDLPDTTTPPTLVAPAVAAPFADTSTPPVSATYAPPMTLPAAPSITIPQANPVPPTSPSTSPTAPPPVPPPMTDLPPFVLPNQQ